MIDALRISDAKWHELLDQIDQSADATGDKRSARRHERVAYRNMTYMIVSVRQDRVNKQKFLVRTHNISQSGLAYLHGNYMHVGTCIELVMLHQTRGVARVLATVRRCTHLTGTVHHIGVEFDQPLDDLDGYLNARLNQGDLETLS